MKGQWTHANEFLHIRPLNCPFKALQSLLEFLGCSNPYGAATEGSVLLWTKELCHFSSISWLPRGVLEEWLYFRAVSLLFCLGLCSSLKDLCGCWSAIDICPCLWNWGWALHMCSVSSVPFTKIWRYCQIPPTWTEFSWPIAATCSVSHVITAQPPFS